MIYLFFLFFILPLQENYFCGTIVYEKFSEDRLIGEEVYHFANGKLRIDISSHFEDTIIHSSEIYLFETHPGFVFRKNNGVYIKTPYKGISLLEEYVVSKTAKKKFCELECRQELYKLRTYWGISYKLEMDAQIWTTGKLPYVLPKACKAPTVILASPNSKIALKSVEVYQTPHSKTLYITRLAKSVEFALVDEDVFVLN